MIRAILTLEAAAEDFVEDWLWIQGALAVSTSPKHSRKRVLTALFPDRFDKKAFLDRLQRDTAEQPGRIFGAAFEPVAQEDWQTAWRKNFKPVHAGRFQLIGEWVDAPPSPRTIRIYPGQAFGTGQHETTQLMIGAMEREDFANKRVLDAGCGTGVLSIVAERLGAADVFGFDNDPDCAENMARHLRINKTERVRLEIGGIDDFQHDPYDIVLANITLNVLTEIWPRAASLLPPGGLLVSSGVLEEQREAALSLLAKAGFIEPRVDRAGEWLALTARRA